MMVARGFGQIYNVDFFEAFAPTPSAASVKIALAAANELYWLLRHLNIKQVLSGIIQAHLVYWLLQHLDIKQVLSGIIQAHLDEAVLHVHEASPRLRGHEWSSRPASTCCVRTPQDGIQRSLQLGRVLLQKTDIKQSKADPRLILKVVDGEVTLNICVFMLTT